MAAAVVQGSPAVQRALTAPVLALMARNLIRRGEDHHRIYVRGGGIVLEPVGFAHAHGNGPDPMTWTYNSTLYGPTDSRHEWVPAASMVHCRYAVDAARPWLGVPPWSWAAATGEAIAALDRFIANEARAPHGHLLGVPAAPALSDDDETGPLDAFRGDVAKAKGRTLIMEDPRDWSADGGVGPGERNGIPVASVRVPDRRGGSGPNGRRPGRARRVRGSALAVSSRTRTGPRNAKPSAGSCTRPCGRSRGSWKPNSR